MRQAIKPVIVALAAALLAACATQGLVGQPEIRFTDKAPIALQVGRIDVEDAYVSPQAAPNVEHLFPVVPAAAMRAWANDRLRAGGGPGTARFVVVDAGVVEKHIEQDKGLVGAITTRPAERYEARIEGRVEILDASGARQGFADMVVVRSRTVPESASPAERDQAFYEMTRTMMVDFDAGMEKTLRDNLARYLR